MYGKDILRGIWKVLLEIPHNTFSPYIDRCVLYLDMKI